MHLKIDPRGMAWLVLGMAPGVDYLCAHPTRAEAERWLREEYDPDPTRAHDYYAIVKARDFFQADN